MYQLNPLLESEDNSEKLSGPQKAGLRLGAYGTGLAGALGIKNNLDKVTGIETRYHNTPGHVADQVLDQGILGKYATDPNNLTNRVLGDKAKKQGLDGLVYLAKKKTTADQVGLNRVNHGIELSKGRTLKVKIPYDEYLKLQRVANPELMGAKTADEYIRRLTTDPSIIRKLKDHYSMLPENQKQQVKKFLETGNFEDLGKLPKAIHKLLYKLNYKLVGKGTDTIKGNISPEFIEGSKHFRKNMGRSNFLKYVKNHPGRFAKGVGGVGLGAAGLGTAGYLVKKSFDSKKD